MGQTHLVHVAVHLVVSRTGKPWSMFANPGTQGPRTLARQGQHPPHAFRRSHPFVNLLEIQSLKKSFPKPDGGRQTVVNVADFALAEKAQVALSGESGCGKTTFLHLIAGILKADSGLIRLGGREMTALSEPQRDRLRATTLGYIFQTFNLLQGYTCLENVLLGMSFGPGADRAFARALLERVGLGLLTVFVNFILLVGVMSIWLAFFFTS